MSNLWKLQFRGTKSLPVLMRGQAGATSTDITDLKSLTTASVYGDQSAQIQDPINVAKEFAWTNSPIESRYDIPKIQMIEKRIIYNSTITNIIYSLAAATDDLAGSLIAATGADLGRVTGVTAGVSNIFSRFFPSNTAEEDQKKEEDQGFATKLKEDILAVGFLKTFDSNVLQPYNLLYATEFTGFNYFFPYLDDSYRESKNTFGENTSIIAPIADLIRKGADLTGAVAGALKPGTYIEKSKQFTMGDAGRTLTFSFPLLNTGTFEDVRKNWQLIFGLIYQNRPGRVSKSIIDVPVIYEVHLPGVAYMPYAYISNLEVKFLGNRREMKMNVPIMDEGEGNSATELDDITTTIPDAYEVTISVTGLNEETRNFMYASVHKNNITVKPARESVATENSEAPLTPPGPQYRRGSQRRHPASLTNKRMTQEEAMFRNRETSGRRRRTL